MHKKNSQTSYKQQLREKILKTSMSEFAAKGIKAVKMDDIAALLGISKRTLYEIYPNKEALLLEGIKLHDEEYSAYMKEFGSDPSHNVIDIIKEFHVKHIEWLSGVNPLFISDIHKYNRVTEYFKMRNSMHHKDNIMFYERGVAEGIFRKDVDYEVLTQILNASIEHMKGAELYKEIEFSRIFNNLILLFIRGVCTIEGIEQFDELLNARS